MQYKDLKDSDYLSKDEIVEAYNELIEKLESLWDDFVTLREEEGINVDVEISEHGAFNLDHEDFLSHIRLEHYKEEVESFFKFEEDVENYGDTIVKESKFVDYTKDFVRSTCSFDAPDWVVIDWEETAKKIKPNYTVIEWGEDTYHVL